MFNFITVCAQLLSHVQLFANPWTVDSQAPLSLEFSRQEYWNGLLFLPPEHRPNPGIEPTIPASPAVAGKFFTASVSKPARVGAFIGK